MTRTYEKPTRSEGGTHYDYTENHPAFAMIGASRVSSMPGASLFDSDFLHQHFVTVRIHGAFLKRGLSNDSIFADKEYIEVALSEAQWATFVSSMNVGSGVPCTLTYKQGEGYVPQIEPATNRRDQFNDEVADTVADSIKALEALRDAAPTKKLKDMANAAIQQLKANLPWVAEQFDEHAEKTVEKAKIEVNAYLTAAVQRAGLQALGAEPMLELAEPEERR